MRIIKDLLKNELGQDLTEYGLLLAFVLACAAALFYDHFSSINGIWNLTNDNVQTASRIVNR